MVPLSKVGAFEPSLVDTNLLFNCCCVVVLAESVGEALLALVRAVALLVVQHVFAAVGPNFQSHFLLT